jgi:hypothetical protein
MNIPFKLLDFFCVPAIWDTITGNFYTEPLNSTTYPLEI